MTPANNYFFVDGSALLADVKVITNSDPWRGRKLDLREMVGHFAGHYLQRFHGNNWRRFVFYFVKDDDRLERHLILPNPAKPGGIGDIRVEPCGRSVRGAKKVTEWLDEKEAPDHVRECLYRSEKAVDTQICVDALQLAAVNKLDRLFLYTNDYDFVPLCRTLRQLGCNISLFRLPGRPVNAELARECDSYDEPAEYGMQAMFPPPKEPVADSAAPPAVPDASPPDAPPSQGLS